MVLTESQTLPIGTRAPDFSLIDTRSDRTISLADMRSEKATVILFICNHCPYVQHIQKTLVECARLYRDAGIAFAAISSNDAETYPEDAPNKMCKVAKQWDYPFPYLYDETQDVARAYQAVCTPELYIFDGQLACVYHGQFDASTPGNGIPVTGNKLKLVLDSLLLGRPLDMPQLPSVGCNIKWKE